MFNLRADMKLAPISRLSGDICEVKRGNLENFVESGEEVNTIKSAVSKKRSISLYFLSSVFLFVLV